MYVLFFIFIVGSHLYSTPEQLFKRLQGFCKHPHLARQHVTQVGLHFRSGIRLLITFWVSVVQRSFFFSMPWSYSSVRIWSSGLICLYPDLMLYLRFRWTPEGFPGTLWDRSTDLCWRRVPASRRDRRPHNQGRIWTLISEVIREDNLSSTLASF